MFYHRNSELPADVRAVLNRRGQGAWRLLYNDAIDQGATAAEAMQAAWSAVNKQHGCRACGQGRTFFK